MTLPKQHQRLWHRRRLHLLWSCVLLLGGFLLSCDLCGPLAACVTPCDKGKTLFIVESSTKVRAVSSILRTLGWEPQQFQVEASRGHICHIGQPHQLAEEGRRGGRRLEVGQRTFGINLKNFEAEYVVSSPSIVEKLSESLASAKQLVLATDPDREGEAIAWHLKEHLKVKPNIAVHRVSWSEITADAVKQALETAVDIDENLVEAQKARQSLDRLLGFAASGYLQAEIPAVDNALSAGRVQTPGLSLLVKREEEIQKFKRNAVVKVAVEWRCGNQAPEWRLKAKSQRMDPDDDLLPLEQAQALQQALMNSSHKDSVVMHTITAREKEPPPPFSTVTLIREAEKCLGLKPDETMKLAQKLFETGCITYMRTDSEKLSEEGAEAARTCARDILGEELVPSRSSASRKHKASKHSQEAHEAVRPSITDGAFRSVTSLPTALGNRNNKLMQLYELIWNRTLASQMPPAKYENARVTIQVEFTKQTVGVPQGKQIWMFNSFTRTLIEPGFLRFLDSVRVSSNSSAQITVGTPLKMILANLEKRMASPPPRYTQASLIQELEKRGIGRPSTWHRISSKLLERGYVEEEKKRGKTYLRVTALGEKADRYIKNPFPHMADDAYTAQMERRLKDIEEGKLKRKEFLKDAWIGRQEEGMPSIRELATRARRR